MRGQVGSWKGLVWTPYLPLISPVTLAKSLNHSLSFLICRVGIK